MTDTELMLAVRGGDLDALGALFRRHYDTAHALCYRLTTSAEAADDLAQETFLRILRYRHTFRGDAQFTTWMYRLARNVCLDHLRAAARADGADARWAADEGQPTRPEAEPGDAARLAAVEAALARLPVEQREALVLSRYHDMRYDAIARTLDCSPGAARVRVHRALKALRAMVRATEEQTEERP
ncbi:MAG TPA: RNA polymerase sigma factor [Gemmatimonadaceae bacterium]|nr:RNA polymerase sigma factor [Gemmatimonadaceae bacterium]